MTIRDLYSRYQIIKNYDYIIIITVIKMSSDLKLKVSQFEAVEEVNHIRANT